MNTAKKFMVKIQPILLILMVLFMISTFHSYFNLQESLKGPSEDWARGISIKEKIPHKQSPAAFLTEESAELLIINGSQLEHASVNRNTAEITSKIVVIGNINPEKITKLYWNDAYVFWTENFDMYYSAKAKDGGYSNKVLLEQNVKNFDVVDYEEGCYLITVGENLLTLYRPNNSEIAKESSFVFQKAKDVSVVLSNNKELHIAAVSSDNDIHYNIKYLVYKNADWSLITEKIETYLSGTWKISDIELGIDDTDAYIFYQLGKWDNRGMAASIKMTVVPLNKTGSEMSFNYFYASTAEENKGTPFAIEPKCSKLQASKLSLAVVKDTVDVRRNDMYTVYAVVMDNGKVEKVQKSVKDMDWISNLRVYEDGQGKALTYLGSAGKGEAEVLYSDSSVAFRNGVSKATSKDYFYAFLNAIPGYVTSSLIGMIKVMLFLPAMLWIIAVEFFEIRSLRKKPKLVNAIALGIYTIIKLFNAQSYYTSLSVLVMPSVLKFTGAPYIISLATIFVSLLIARLFSRANKEISHLVEFLIFAFTDIIITTLIYTTYLS